MHSKEDKIKTAISKFGSEIVDFVMSIVYLADPDGAWSLFEERGMHNHSECVKDIYFE